MDVKRCTKCGEIKPLNEFHLHTQNGGVRPQCKACRKIAWHAQDHTEYHAKYYATHKEKRLGAHREYRMTHGEEIAAKNKVWREQNRDRLRSYVLKRNYGITLEQWREIFASQGNACRICGSTDPKNKRGWHTDHGVTVRGILCHHCNTGLGAFNHDVVRMKAAIRYLQK